MLSVGYGRNPAGVLRRQFGSLSTTGGERRLNVAVSRAREKMVVVCSFEPRTDFSDQGVNSAGTLLLRKFLLYARSAGQDVGLATGPSRVAISERVEAPRRVVSRYVASLGLGVRSGEQGRTVRPDVVLEGAGTPTCGVLLSGPSADWAGDIIGREVSRWQFFQGYGWQLVDQTLPDLARRSQRLLERVDALEDGGGDAVAEPLWFEAESEPVDTKPTNRAGERVRAQAVTGFSERTPLASAAQTIEDLDIDAAHAGTTDFSVLEVTEAATKSEPATVGSTPTIAVLGSLVRYTRSDLDGERWVELGEYVGADKPEATMRAKLGSTLASALIDAQVGEVLDADIGGEELEIHVLEVRYEDAAGAFSGDAGHEPREPAPTWHDLVGVGGVRELLVHLELHGTVDETEASQMLGGAREVRRFSRALDEYRPLLPFAVRIDVVGGVKRFVREGMSADES